MSEQEGQTELFPQDQRRKMLEQLNGKIGLRAGEVRKSLENTKEFINLIKDGPRLVADMYFRCGKLELAKETLHLLRSQATELACLFEEAELSLSVIDDWKSQKEEIKRLIAEEIKGLIAEETATPTEEQLEHGPDYDAEGAAAEGDSAELERIANGLLAEAEAQIQSDIQDGV